MITSERWYKGVTTPILEQGDLLYAFPVVMPTMTADDVQSVAKGVELEKPAKVDLVNVVIMTQSCDLENDKTETVILCPIWKLDELNLVKSKKEQIRKGYQPGWHLLNCDEDLDISYTVVEFSRLFMAPKAALEGFAGRLENRPRLVSPYKEHLSQAFARYFMRVGLPSNIPPF